MKIFPQISQWKGNDGCLGVFKSLSQNFFSCLFFPYMVRKRFIHPNEHLNTFITVKKIILIEEILFIGDTHKKKILFKIKN